MKGFHLIEDGATPTLFQTLIDYECGKLMTLKPANKEEFAELHILKTCLMYIRTLEDIEFQTLVRKVLNPSDIDLLVEITSILSY